MLPFRHVKHEQLVVARALTNNATASASTDTTGYDYATLLVNISSAANTNAVGPTISLLESDDTVVTNHATITADVTGVPTNAKPIMYGIDLRGRKRYLRLTVSTATATNDNLTVSADLIYSRLSSAPTGTTGIVSTNGVCKFA